jgi:prepilin-type N-terminal cleavage/methylation domain-containing protein
MSMERGARSRESEARSTVGGACLPAARNHRLVMHDRSAFTLIELLVVIAIIAVLSALLVPSMQGLFGVVGRRGGANTLAMGFEQAKLEAIKHGTAAFVGFANSTNEDAFSSFIVYRALRFDESATNTNLFTPVSRWIRLPRGVFIAPPTLAAAVTSTQSSITPGLLPRLGGSNVASLRSIKFDRFGKLDTTNTDISLRVGEGILTGDQLVFTPNENNYYELTIQPLTGQVVMRDGAVEEGQP